MGADVAMPADCSAMHIGGARGSFDVSETFVCVSRDIAYVILCERCKFIYIGKTGRRWADRIAEHIRSVRKNFYGFPVAS